jgi:hypothetical protein
MPNATHGCTTCGALTFCGGTVERGKLHACTACGAWTFCPRLEASAAQLKATKVPPKKAAAKPAAQIPKPPRRPPEGFPGKTPVITDERIMHMQDVSQSHRVLDRNGSWQPVTNVHRRKGSTVRVSGHGHAGIEASDGHPVLVRSTSNGGTPGWMSAGLLDRKRHA